MSRGKDLQRKATQGEALHRWQLDFTSSGEPWLVWPSGLSVGCESKGRWFNSQSGHMPGLRARSPMGAT